MKYWDGCVPIILGGGGGGGASVDGKVWKHLNSIAIQNLVLDPALRSALVHFEGANLHARRTAWQSEADLSMF